MTDEFFDVVNERDEVIDQRRRSEVHRLGLRHRAVHILVFNRQGELFLQLRSSSKDCDPGLWDSSASGHLNPGETYDACALRELREELGLRTDPAPERLFKVEACQETGQEFVWVYRCWSEGPFQLQTEEIERGQWCSLGNLERWLETRPKDFAGGFRCVWRVYCRDWAGRGSSG